MYNMTIQYNNTIIKKMTVLHDGLHSTGQGSSVSCSANILYSHRLQNKVMCI